MKRIILSLVTIAATTVYAQNPLAPALGFNVFLEKNARLTTNETDGPMAMGGSLYVSGNYQVSTNSQGNYTIGGVPITLVVGGRVNYTSGVLQVNQNGYVKIGDSTGSYTWYRDQNNAASPIRITNGNNYNSSSRIQMQANAVNLGVSVSNNPVFASTNIRFTEAFNSFRTSSSVMSVCPNNVQLTNPNGQPIPNNNLPNQIKINLSNGTNVLNLTGADLNRVQIITFNQQPSSSKVLLINVDAAGTFNWEVWNQAGIGGINSAYIIYNFYNTTTLNIKGSSTIEGTLFAPNADIFKTVNQANIEGQVIAQSLSHSGGEIHYFPFGANIASCAVQTRATFSVNNNKQCIYNNEFQFSSSNTGTAPLSYFWDFGDGTTSNLSNPVKTYATAGYYTVKHKLIGLAGADSTTQQVFVSTKPAVGFSINDSIQPITGNVFLYNTLFSGAGYSYEWRYGDGSPYGNTVNAFRTYQATGPYFVCQIVTDSIGCTDTATAWVLVISDSCGSGGDGGLESETLGGLVGWREFTKSKNSVPRKADYALSPVFVGDDKNNRLGKKSAEITLHDLIPTTFEQGDVSRITTPTDLVNITSALEVISVDYTRNNVPKAVVLGIKTKTKAYTHTKYICDRLKGADLISIDSVTIKGYNFVRYLLRQQDGSIEFGTSFVLGKKEGRASMSLQTNWLLAEMAHEDTLFNFQVWSVTPEGTNKLVSDIIDLVEVNSTIEQWNEVHIPKVYVTKGYRKGSKLVLHFRNLDKPSTIELAMEERLNEQAMLTQRNFTYNLAKGEEQVVELMVNDGYEYSANITIDTFITDVIYFADGNWGLDYDRQYTTITRYNTNNEPSRVYDPKAFSVYRHASVSVLTDDYIMLFKGVQQGNAPANLTTYDAVEFFASGTGTAVMTLVKDGIVNWKDQYQTVVTLVPEGKMYRVPFTDFKSANLTGAFQPNDVRMVTFSRGYQAQSGTETIDLSLGSMAFTSSATGVLNKAIEGISVGVKPNPNNGSFYLDFKANTSEKVTVKVTDVLGREIYSQSVTTLKGNNQFYFDIAQLAPKGSLLFIKLESTSTKYNTARFVVE